MNITSTGRSQLESFRLLGIRKRACQSKVTGGFRVSRISLEINRRKSLFLWYQEARNCSKF